MPPPLCKINVLSSVGQKFLSIDYYIQASIMYSMLAPHCWKCKTYETEGLFVSKTRIRKSGKKYFEYMCRACNAEKKRTEILRNPATNKRNVEKYRAKMPERVKARESAKRNIPLQPCSICGNPKAVRHHPDYSKPLEVEFYCHLHHRQVHPVGAY